MGKRNSIEAETPGACWAAFSSLSWGPLHTLIFSQARVPRSIAVKSFVQIYYYIPPKDPSGSFLLTSGQTGICLSQKYTQNNRF